MRCKDCEFASDEGTAPTGVEWVCCRLRLPPWIDTDLLDRARLVRADSACSFYQEAQSEECDD